MAVLSFCGADGMCFRGGKCNPWAKYGECKEELRPNHGSCFGCRLYLAAQRAHNREPFRWRGIVVSGPRGKEGRLSAGLLARVGVTHDSP